MLERVSPAVTCGLAVTYSVSSYPTNPFRKQGANVTNTIAAIVEQTFSLLCRLFVDICSKMYAGLFAQVQPGVTCQNRKFRKRPPWPAFARGITSMSRFLLLLTTTVTLATPVLAQTGLGSITGNVQDSSGAVIAGAT